MKIAVTRAGDLPEFKEKLTKIQSTELMKLIGNALTPGRRSGSKL